MLFLSVIDQGRYEIFSLFLKVVMRDPDEVIAVYDDVGNMKPPEGMRNFFYQSCSTRYPFVSSSLMIPSDPTRWPAPTTMKYVSPVPRKS